MNTNEIVELYRRLLDAWNNQDASAMANLFAEDGESIGFDGSQSVGIQNIYSHLKPIFDNHVTARFVYKIKSVKLFATDFAVLRAIAGMVPPGKSDLNPAANTHHTIVAVKKSGKWFIQLFQNTPAQFHGHPELVEEMTNELRELIR